MMLSLKLIGLIRIRITRAIYNSKRYGVLFTCLTIRAIHLEVAPSLDTDACVNAIHRLIFRRGPVSVIRSDNGTNFMGAERELREALQNLNQATIQEEMSCLQDKFLVCVNIPVIKLF